MASSVIKKVNQRTRFLYRISSLVNKNTLKTLAGALIQGYYDYACTSGQHKISFHFRYTDLSEPDLTSNK
ncbi:hypothetical protein NQZ68_007375 [Dissostichus eleginoides]|nr:hypothetical protein NQZ68_007375 [Dissostichus eleginoides]